MDEGGFNFAGFVISFAQPATPIGKQIVIKNGSNYLTFNEQNQVICNSPTITPNCVFTVEQNNNYIEFKAADGRYIATGGLKNPMIMSSSNRSGNTKFLWHNLQNNSKMFGLKTLLGNAVVTSENGLRPMNANRYDFGGWEKFTWAEYTGSSIDEAQVEEASLNVYPMPAASNSSITARIRFNNNDLSPVSMQLIDMQGKVCKQIEVLAGNEEVTISLNGIPSGLYILKATSQGFFATQKIVIF
jgi:hypothetical protein